MKLFVDLGVGFLCHKSYIGFLKVLLKLLLSPECESGCSRQAGQEQLMGTRNLNSICYVVNNVCSLELL